MRHRTLFGRRIAAMSMLVQTARGLGFAAMMLAPSMACFAQQLPQAYNPYVDRANKPQPNPLADRLTVEIVLNRPEMGLESPDTSAIAGMMGGLTGGIGGMITAMADDATREPDSWRTRALTRLRDHLGEYDFNGTIEPAIRRRIASPGLSPDPVIMPLNMPLSGPPFASNALIIYPSYVVDYRFDRMKVVLFVRVVNRRLDGKGRMKTAVTFRRTYASVLLVSDGSREENLDRWLAMEPARLRGLLDKASDEAIELLVHDFSDAGRREWKLSAEKKSARLRGVVLPGLPIRKDDERVWVRSGTRLQWLDAFSFAEPASP